MLQTLRRNFAAISAAVVMLAAPLALAPAVVYAAGPTSTPGGSTDSIGIGNSLNCGSNIDVTTGDTSGAGCTNNNVTNGSKNVSSLIVNIINVFSAVIGAISVIMIIVGGFQYVTSGGDSGKIGNARNTITYAIVGLVIVAMAQFLVQFVLNKISSIGG